MASRHYTIVLPSCSQTFFFTNPYSLNYFQIYGRNWYRFPRYPMYLLLTIMELSISVAIQWQRWTLEFVRFLTAFSPGLRAARPHDLGSSFEPADVGILPFRIRTFTWAYFIPSNDCYIVAQNCRRSTGFSKIRYELPYPEVFSQFEGLT